MIDYLYVDDLQIHATETSILTRVAGLTGSPAPRRDVWARAARHGSIDLTTLYDGRVIDLAGESWGADDLAAWLAFDAMEGKFALGAERTIRFRRSGFSEDEQVVVRVASAVAQEVSGAETFVTWAVSLYAEDPRIYSATLRGGTYDPTASLSGGGVAFPIVFPIMFATTTVTHLELTNAGNFSTPPVLTVTGPILSPAIDNDTTGESIYIGYALGASDVVVIDVGERSVTLNGVSRPDLFIVSTSKWWELQTGTNRLRLRGSGMASATTRLLVQYRDARI